MSPIAAGIVIKFLMTFFVGGLGMGLNIYRLRTLFNIPKWGYVVISVVSLILLALLFRIWTAPDFLALTSKRF